MWWKAEVEYRTDLLQPGNNGKKACVVGHRRDARYSLNCSLGVNHGIEQDGRVAVLTVIRED